MVTTDTQLWTCKFKKTMEMFRKSKAGEQTSESDKLSSSFTVASWARGGGCLWDSSGVTLTTEASVSRTSVSVSVARGN